MLASAPPMLYRQFFTPAERQMLDDSPLSSALSEIHLLRVLLRRLLEAAHLKRFLSLKSHLSLLATIAQSGLIIASLARYQWKAIDGLPENDPVLASIAVHDLSEL